jgi:hypothetical protein
MARFIQRASSNACRTARAVGKLAVFHGARQGGPALDASFSRLSNSSVLAVDEVVLEPNDLDRPS